MTEPERWERWRDLRRRQMDAETDEQREALDVEEAELRDEGINELLMKDAQNKPVWWWLSFADENGFLGVAIVKAGGLMEAVLVAEAFDCNPGGEVKGVEIPEGHVPKKKFRERLLDKDEIAEAQASAA